MSTADTTQRITNPLQQKLLTVTEVAQWLRVSRGWVHDHASGRRKPVMPTIKLGRSVRFRPEQVQDWLDTLSKQQAA